MKKLRHLFSYAAPYKGYILLNISCNLFSIIFSLFSLTMIIPFLDLIFLKSAAEHAAHTQQLPVFELSVDSLKAFFYYYFSGMIVQDPESGKVNALIFLCVLIVLMIFLKNLFRYLALFYTAQFKNSIVRDLRNRIYTKVLRLPLSFFTEEKKGDIITRMSNDVQEIEITIISSLELLFRDPVSIVVFLGAMVIMSPQLTLFILVLLPVTGFLIGRIGKSLKRTSVKGQHRLGLLISHIEETLTGMRIIKAFNAEKQVNEKFTGSNNHYKDLMVKMNRKRDLSAPMSEFMGVAVLVVVIWFGGKMILTGNEELSASVFIAYIAIFSQLIPPAKSFTTAYYNLQKGAASVDRVNKVLKAEEKILEKPGAKPVKEFKEKIAYKNVSFRYSTEDVLKNINLEIEKGKTVALVGSSGGGKSTLADLLPRFYDPLEGEVLVDNIPITEYKIKDLRDLMGIVTQESILFNDTVHNNIAFGLEKVSREEVINAAKIANAHDFIVEMQNGYDSNIGERGGKLSGGQRQRLSIARAVLKNPPVLILDEATSALDTESEKLVQQALSKLMENRTSLVIAHRLSTIQNADVIVVMEKGEILEKGTHDQLLAANGAYKRLCDMQSFG